VPAAAGDPASPPCRRPDARALLVGVPHKAHPGLLLVGRGLDGLGLPALFLCASHLSAQPSLGVVAGDFAVGTDGIMALLGGVERRAREERSP
jgi:hypothetical protein